MLYHSIAFFLGFLLDLILGDPYWLPHPIRLIGNLIVALEKRFLSKETKGKEHKEKEKSERRRGTLLVFIVLSVTFAVISISCYWNLSAASVSWRSSRDDHDLSDLSGKMLKGREHEGLSKPDKRRNRRGKKSGSNDRWKRHGGFGWNRSGKGGDRDSSREHLGRCHCTYAVYSAGGPVLGFLYKAVNTMDSMIGYKNEKYLNFGRTAAKSDDVCNYLPSRISAYLMIAAAYLGGSDFSGKGAYRIYKRDRRNHASPNSAQTESVCAGALGIQLAGDAVYFGKVVKKPHIGDDTRPVEYEDIRWANRLMYLTAWLGETGCLFFMVLIILL